MFILLQWNLPQYRLKFWFNNGQGVGCVGFPLGKVLDLGPIDMIFWDRCHKMWCNTNV